MSGSGLDICPICKQTVQDEDPNTIECDGCVRWLHRNCAGVKDSVFVAIAENPGLLSWFCSICTDQSKCLKPNQFDKLVEMINSTNAEIKSVKEQQAKIMNDLSSFASAISDSIMKEVSAQVADQIEMVKKSISISEASNLKKFEQMEGELDKFKRTARRNDILLSGIPIECTDLRTIFLNICKLLKFEIEPSDISSCFRLGGKNNIILVKIGSADKRDKLMKSYWAFGKLKLSQVLPALKIESRIFMNDNLSPLMSRMFNYAKVLKKNSVIKSFFVGNGFIRVMDANNVATKVFSVREFKEAFSENGQPTDAAHVPVLDAANPTV